MSRLASYEERPIDQWVAFYCRAAPPKKFSVRLFPNLDRARDYYGKTCKTLFESYAELSHRFGGTEMLEAYRVLREREACKTSLRGAVEGPHVEDVDDSLQFNRGEIAKRLWDLIQQVADRVSGINLINELDEELYVIRLDRMTQPDNLEAISSFNRQKRVVCEGLISLGKSKADEIELTEMMRRLVSSGTLKTKQDPMRIFRYYAPELGDLGFLYYPSKRHKVADHDQNS